MRRELTADSRMIQEQSHCGQLPQGPHEPLMQRRHSEDLRQVHCSSPCWHCGCGVQEPHIPQVQSLLHVRSLTPPVQGCVSVSPGAHTPPPTQAPQLPHWQVVEQVLLRVPVLQFPHG